MFKELKYVKLVFFVGLFAAMIYSTIQDFEHTEVFTHQPSYSEGENAKIYIASNAEGKSELIQIQDLFGNTRQEFEVSYPTQFEYLHRGTFLKDGFSTEHFSEVVLELKSGIYTFSGQSNLVVRGQGNAEVTIVYPFANNHFYGPTGERTIFSEKIGKISLNRQVDVDLYTLGMKEVFRSWDSLYSTNYISDLDLEEESYYSESKVLVLYGRTWVFTPKMRENLLNFIHQGGNVLLLSSNMVDSRFWYDAEQKALFNNQELSESHENGFTSYFASLSLEKGQDFGVDQRLGGKVNDVFNSDYLVLNTTHALFDGVEEKSIPIEGKYFSGVSVSWNDEKPEVVSSDKEVEILAYNKCGANKGNENIGGIFSVKLTPESGTIISLGTEDWCLEKNQSKPVIRKITINAVANLLHH